MILKRHCLNREVHGPHQHERGGETFQCEGSDRIASGGGHICARCAAVTSSPQLDRCGRCHDWPEWDAYNPKMGDFARLAEHLHASGGWLEVAAGLMDAYKAFERTTET